LGETPLRRLGQPQEGVTGNGEGARTVGGSFLAETEAGPRAKQALQSSRMPLGESFQESRMPGNPLVRFDEGRVGRTARCPPSLLLYRLGERLFVLTIEENQESRKGAKTQRRAGQACGAIEFHGPLTPAQPERGLCARCLFWPHRKGQTRLR
jgi:hypothetical protein